VALLLISTDFLNSTFIRGTEMPRLLARRQDQGLRIIPVFVRPCAWKAVPWLTALQGRPRNGKALAELRSHQVENELSALALEIRENLARSAAGGSLAVIQSQVLPMEPTATKEREKVDQKQDDLSDVRDTGSRPIKERGKVALGFSSTGRRIWVAGAAPVPIILGIQWVLGVYFLHHFVTQKFGTGFGTLSPLWLLPTSYATVRFVTRDPGLARIVGALLGGITGATVSQIFWGPVVIRYGLVFGAFFASLLAGYFSAPTKQIGVIGAIFSTALLLACLGLFHSLNYVLILNGYAFEGTAWAIVFWSIFALLVKLGLAFWRMWRQDHNDNGGEN
jgi:hypothetical protein